ncbi:MAG: GNAT family N-acetyltransferase [Chloroflexota bacterium]|nr:GNAT family N-acetyltransferase [Chloroflexota bacterium]MDE2942230.1 GNAT family N-acetyltransferase [Chloroflexota bacterium]MDE3267697.1 GNAT family N-acetyltransferase [Chloroflexota bacterium]
MDLSFSLESFRSVDAEWQDILACSDHSSIFLTPYWQGAWWESMGADGQELRIVKFTDGESTVGIAPLMKDGGLITFLGSTDLWDMHDFIVVRGREHDFYRGFMEYLEGEEWSEVRLESVPEASHTLSHLPTLAAERGRRVEQVEEDTLMGVSLPGTWDEYLMGLRKKDRHELRRKLRRLGEAVDYRIYRLSDANDVADAMDDFLDLMGQSREEKSRFLTDERYTFFRDMSPRMAELGLLHLFFLEVEGVRTAATVCFDYNNVWYLYNSGHNTDYAALGTSFLLKAMCIQDAIGEGKAYFDLLRGTEQYKYHLGATGRGLYTLSILR